MGKVYLIGAGPGDPELLTMKGLKCIKKADVIYYDQLINSEMITYIHSNAKRGVCIPYDKDGMETGGIRMELFRHAEDSKTVVYLTKGDPFLFSGCEETAYDLAEKGIVFEVVPGISEGLAAAAYIGVPVTHREYACSFVILSASKLDDHPDSLRSIAASFNTLVIQMDRNWLSTVQDKLLQAGWAADTPVAYIQEATTADQYCCRSLLTSTQKIAGDEKVHFPGILLVGDVVTFNDKINWFNPHNKQLPASVVGSGL
ncbi:uroporphyrinogen-III C-methyltransferase [Fictibacillus sp. NRS-1165]|uniref:uroporphyrinogen-III C-methyltransferase n=1 Tax=Fictibacillus sp. NRS-1165 TaxID=3144463 RepID=UPI003D235EDB